MLSVLALFGCVNIVLIMPALYARSVVYTRARAVSPVQGSGYTPRTETTDWNYNYNLHNQNQNQNQIHYSNDMHMVLPYTTEVFCF